MLPSRLKEYPRGNTKLTIFFGQPDFSSSSISLGNAASELAVVNASNTMVFYISNDHERLFCQSRLN